MSFSKLDQKERKKKGENFLAEYDALMKKHGYMLEPQMMWFMGKVSATLVAVQVPKKSEIIKP